MATESTESTDFSDAEEAVMMAIENIFDGFSTESVESLQSSIKLLKDIDSNKVLQPFMNIRLVGMMRTAPNAEYLHKIMSVFVDSGFVELEVFQRITVVLSAANAIRNVQNKKLVFDYITSPRGPFAEQIYRSVIKKAVHVNNIEFLQFIDANRQIKLVGNLGTHELLGLEYYRLQRMKELNTETDIPEYVLGVHLLRRNSDVQAKSIMKIS